VVVPFAAAQQVKIVCPHCRAIDVRLRAAVRKGASVRCRACKRSFLLAELVPAAGSTPRGAPKRRR
jgi:transposase-like protein